MVSVPPIEYTQRLLLADEFIAMAEAGAFQGDEHLELLEGVIWTMTPQGPRHRLVSSLVRARFAEYPLDRYHVASHSSMRLDDRSVPEPDIGVARGSHRHWGKVGRLPGPKDFVVLAEVVHTTERADRWGAKVILHPNDTIGLPELDVRLSVAELLLLD